MELSQTALPQSTPWNKGKLIGQRPALRLQEVWAIRIRLQLSNNLQELALFNLAIDSKLRSCDFVKLKVSDISNMDSVATRAIVLQKKTQISVQFEITPATRDALTAHIQSRNLAQTDYLFKSRLSASEHISTRQYARIVKRWVAEIGLGPAVYATHSIRRTMPSLIYKRTKNLQAIQLLLGHTKLGSTVKYLGVEVDDALEMTEHTEV